MGADWAGQSMDIMVSVDPVRILTSEPLETFGLVDPIGSVMTSLPAVALSLVLVVVDVASAALPKVIKFNPGCSPVVKVSV